MQWYNERTMKTVITSKRDEIKQLAANYGAHNVRVFGSIARGEARSDSDVDLLVDLESDRSLFDLGGLLVSFTICSDAKSMW
jgi:predicted nucleotidyltransferase